MDLTPDGVDGVRDAVASLRTEGSHAVVAGGATLLHVGGEPSAPLLRTGALRSIVYHEAADLIVACQAAVTLDALAAELEPSGQVVPVWHPAPGSATVGGLAAFGWGGLGRQLYGRLRDRILEVTVVTGEAKLVRGGARVVKNVTGFDLPRVFVGSMGTLGVIVEVALKVHPRPRALYCVHRQGTSSEIVRWLRDGVTSAPMPVEAVADMSAGGWTGYAFAPGPAGDARMLLSPFGGAPTEADETFARLAADPVLTGGTPDEVGVRLSVPAAALPGMVEALPPVRRAIVDVASGAAWIAGDVPAADILRLREAAVRAGGSAVVLRAPAGVLAQTGTWGDPGDGTELMRRLKRQFDPDEVLGRGRFVV